MTAPFDLSEFVTEWGNAGQHHQVAALRAAVREAGGTWPQNPPTAVLFEIHLHGVLAVGVSELDAARAWFNAARSRVEEALFA